MTIGNGYIQCKLDNGSWTVSTVTLPGIEYTLLTNDDCNLPMNAYTLTVNFSITKGFKDESIYCNAIPAVTLSPAVLTIPKLLCK